MEAFKQYWRRGGGLLLQRKSDGAVYEVHSCVEAPNGYRIKVSRQIESGTMEFETTFGLREDPLYVPMWR
jgi:hypothetical protein